MEVQAVAQHQHQHHRLCQFVPNISSVGSCRGPLLQQEKIWRAQVSFRVWPQQLNPKNLIYLLVYHFTLTYCWRISSLLKDNYKGFRTKFMCFILFAIMLLLAKTYQIVSEVVWVCKNGCFKVSIWVSIWVLDEFLLSFRYHGKYFRLSAQQKIHSVLTRYIQR